MPHHPLLFEIATNRNLSVAPSWDRRLHFRQPSQARFPVSQVSPRCVQYYDWLLVVDVLDTLDLDMQFLAADSRCILRLTANETDNASFVSCLAKMSKRTGVKEYWSRIWLVLHSQQLVVPLRIFFLFGSRSSPDTGVEQLDMLCIFTLKKKTGPSVAVENYCNCGETGHW
jgi:hypothetical protein